MRRNNDEDIAARTAARAAAIELQLSVSRRLARPEDYVYDKAQDKYWDIRDGTLHVANAVDNSIPIELWRVQVDEAPPHPNGRPARRPRERLVKPSVDIGRVENDQFVEGSTWWPGKDPIIRDWMIDLAGVRIAEGRRIYNQYRPAPSVEGAQPERAEAWAAHVRKLWPNEVEQQFFFDYCAHMIQRPQEKCNAAIILSGTQGIGKDAALLPVRMAMGNWNCRGIEPDELFSAYRPWLQTVMLVVDEVRPSKDEFHASSMYNILKPMIVAPPDTLPLNDKYAHMRYVLNVMRVFITTNDWMSMYIPPEDRRMFVMHSALKQRWHEEEGQPDYFRKFFAWIEFGGWRDVAAWLLARDISNFDPKAQVARTLGWQAVAQTWGEPDDVLAALLERMAYPEAFFATELIYEAFDDADEIRGMLKSPRKIGHRMQRAGYVAVPPPRGHTTWKFDGFKSKLAFAKAEALQDDPGGTVGRLMARGFDYAARRKGNVAASVVTTTPANEGVQSRPM